MSLFVVVMKNKGSGHEYLSDSTGEGFTEYDEAKKAADAEQLEEGDFFEVYVGKVINVAPLVGEAES